MSESQEDLDYIVEALRELLETGSENALRSVLTDIHPSDLALAMNQLSTEETLHVYTCLQPDQAAEVLTYAEEELAEKITDALSDDHLSQLLDLMEPDDAADVIGGIEDEDRSRRLLTLITEESRDDVARLLAHDEESAGGIMTSDYLAFPETWSVRRTIDFLRQSPPETHFTYAFTIDTQGKLRGVFPVQNLVWSAPERPLREIADPEVERVTVDTDQEEVARLFVKLDVVTLPVVDLDGRLIGRITSDDVFDVLQEETSEDIFKMAGSSEDELFTRSAWTVLKLRLPWLVIALVGGGGCASILGVFEFELSQFTYLSFYLPVIMAMGGNIATQSSTLIVRGLATGQLQSRKIFRTLLKEIRVGVMIGTFCGLMAGVFSALYAQSVGYGLVVGVSMVLSMTVAALFGSLVPLTLARMGADPAVASGPFISMSNDALGLFIYLTVARLFSHLLAN